MSAAFGALGYHRVGARSLHSLGQRHGGNNGNYLYSRVFPAFHILSWIPRSRCYNGNALLYYKLCKIVGIGTHKHHVYTERLISHSRLGLSDLFTKVVYGSGAARYKPYSARIGNRAG